MNFGCIMGKAKFGPTLQPNHGQLNQLLRITQNDLPSRSPSPRPNTGYVLKVNADRKKRGSKGGRRNTDNNYNQDGQTPRMAVQCVPEVSPVVTPRVVGSGKSCQLPSINNNRIYSGLDVSLQHSASGMSLTSEDAVRVCPPSTSPISTATTPAALSPRNSIYCRRSSFGSEFGSLNNSARFDVASPWSDRDIVSPTMGITISITTDGINDVRSSNDPAAYKSEEPSSSSNQAKSQKTKRRMSRSERSSRASRQSVTDEYMLYLDRQSTRPKSMSLWENPRIIKLKRFEADPRDDGMLPSVNSGRHRTRKSSDSSRNTSISNASSIASSKASSRKTSKYRRKSKGVCKRDLFPFTVYISPNHKLFR